VIYFDVQHLYNRGFVRIITVYISVPYVVMQNSTHFAGTLNVIRKVLNFMSTFPLKSFRKLFFYSLNMCKFCDLELGFLSFT
jgi:hypothetical protein